MKNWIGVALAGTMCLASLYTCKVYNDVLRVNESLEMSAKLDKVSYDLSLSEWDREYSSLQKEYGVLLRENEEILNRQSFPVFQISESDMDILARCVQSEAGEENDLAQQYVAGAVFNRVASGAFPDTIEEVVYEKHYGVPQFSVAYDGSMEECVPTFRTLYNCYYALVYGTQIPEDVLYFYSAGLKEDNWVKSLKTFKSVQGTVFAYGEGKGSYDDYADNQQVY